MNALQENIEDNMFDDINKDGLNFMNNSINSNAS